MHENYFLFHVLQREILPPQSSLIQTLLELVLIEIKQCCLFKVI